MVLSARYDPTNKFDGGFNLIEEQIERAKAHFGELF